MHNASELQNRQRLCQHENTGGPFVDVPEHRE